MEHNPPRILYIQEITLAWMERDYPMLRIKTDNLQEWLERNT